MEMSRSSAPAAMETTNNVPKPPPPPPPLLPNEKPPPLPLPPSSQQVSVLFREKERQRPRYQSIAFNKGGRDFAAVKQKVAEEGPKISKADLLVGLKNLKRTNRRFIPVSLDREEVFASHGINDYLPLAPVKELLMTQALTSDVVSLNLSGLEQLTDVFFHVLKFFNIRFGSLTKLNCSGCHHLTDTGIRWASEVFTGLQEVEFKGCKNLTERSLYYLLTSEQSFISISMMGTSVGVVPGEYSNTSSSLNLLGCPLVSPPLTIHKEKPRQGFAEYKKDLAPLNTYKAIIVQDSNIPSLGERIVNGTTTPVPSVLSVWLNHQFDRTSAISYNIFQVPDTFSVTDMFLSESSIIFFPYTQSAESAFSNQLIQELATKITAVLSRSPESVYILVGLLDSGDEKSDFTEDVRKSVLEKLAKWKDELEGPIAQTKGRAWRMAEMHFHEQQVWACGESLFQQLGELSQDQASRLLSISLPVKLSPAEERDLFSAMFSKALMTLTQMFSSNYHPSFFPHLHTAIAAIEKQELTLTTSKSIMEKSNIYDAMLNCRETFACTGKILEIMNRVGKCLYFPFVDEKPAVLNLKSWVVFLDKLFNSEAPHRASFRCIGLEVPCWTLSDIRELAGIHSGESLKLHLDVLYKHGCLLKLPRDPWCNVSEESFLFVLVKDLPTQPAVEITHFWPADRPDGEKQANKYFTFMAGLPVSFFPNFLRQCGKLCRFSLLWQTGAFIQQGPVDILVEKLQDARGFSVVVIAGRVQKPKSRGEAHTQYETCLWAAVNTFCGVLEYLIQKYKLYANTTVPCRTCAPSQNHWRILQDEKCYHFQEHLIKGGHDRGLFCKVEKNQDNVVDLRETLGPGMKFSSLVPRHDEEFQKIHNLIRADTYTRCFQCQNCAAEGMDCERNIRNGQTKQHCRCRLYVMVCTFCGVCRRCAKFLAKLNAVLFPCFELPVTPSGGEVSVVGDMVNLKQLGAEIQITQPMTADYFPCLCIMFLRGSMLSLSLDIGGKTLSYNTGEGTISFAGKTTEGTELRCKDGDNFSLHLIHPGFQADLGEKVFQMKLNGFVIFSLPTLSDECKIVSIKALHPSGILLYGPGFMRLPNNALLGEDGTVKKMCMQLTPAGLQAKVGRMRSVVEDALFQIGGVDFGGTAAILLPDNLRYVDLKFASRQSLESLKCHPLCYTRFNIGDMMTIQPTHAAFGSTNKYWLLHLMDAEGYYLERETISESRKLMWAWICLMAFYPEVKVPLYDKLLPQVTGLCSQAEIERGLQELLVLQTNQMLLNMPDSFDQSEFEDKGIALMEQTKPLQNALHSNIEKSGLIASRSLFVHDKLLFLCSGHTASWKVDQGLAEIPKEISGTYSVFLKSIHMQSNDLTSLPAEMFEVLPNLMDIDVSYNYLESIPETIAKCRQLYSLAVTNNNLTDLPMSLADLTGIGRIDISDNRMDAIPPVVTLLSGLLRLNASNLMLTELPEDFGNLEELERLYLNGNCLTKLPASFANLRNMLELNLNGIPWYKPRQRALLSRENFEKFLEKRGISRWLDEHVEDRAELFRNFDEDANGTLDSREIGKLNAAIFSIFPRFGYKGSEPPDEDTPDSFPEELLDLPCLDYLSLQYQAIVRVPPAMERLSNLRSINLSNNPHLLSIPAEAGNLPLTRLELEECALLKTPPKEIREKGFATTYAYLRRLLTGSVECKRTKLMLVGLGGAGKTSLVRSLLSGNHKSALPTDEEITDGIDISTWSVKYQDEHLTYSVWDFAGQTVYYNTHQFFLSNRAVYLLLWNVRLGHEHAGLDFWLSSVCVHAPKAPIFVVGTHYDQVSKIELPVKEMKQRYPQICGFHFVSSLTGQGVQQLQDHLLDITKQQQYMGEQIPGVWLTFENHIVKYRETADVVEYSDVEKKANISGIFDKTEIYQAVQFLHDLGSLQHFTNNFLKSKVVINPQWIVDVMACVVSVKDSHVQEGRLLHSDIGKVWANYPKKLHSWLLRLTEEFDLTFPLHNEEVNLVPCLLPELQPDFDWPELDRNSSLKEAKMIYQFDYLPAGLFNRGQVRLHQFSEGSLIWKRGSFLKKNTHIALIRQIRDCELVVVVQGPRPENILFLIHEVFEGLIVESFQGVTYDLLIPCPDCIKQVLKDPHMFSASTIRRAVELKAPFLQCLKYFHTISMVDLLAVMPPDSHSDYDIHLIQAVRGLKDLRKDMTTDIFISYSCGDIPDGNKKMLHPVTIWTDLETAGYKCWFAEQTKNYTTDEMAVALIDSSVFVALISSHYVKDESCCDLFKYARLTLKKPIIIVVVGEGMDWKQSKLGLLLADEVFVNMTNAKLSSYKSKLDELLKFVKDKIQRDVSPAVRYPKCFISYCWINSATAVSLGTRHVPAALGPGDPRQIKEYLEQRGIECWIDVERVGMNGLFEDIAEGLLNAKMLIACVSDEYASSPTCQLEFRYAANTLKLPIILAVVGTGNNWRATEVGILSLGYPLISFQEKSETALEKLFLASKSKLQSFKGDDEEEKKKTASNEQLKNLSFQELFELAQRKFLRQIINYADAQDMEPYPRLFLVDFVKEESKPEDEEDADSTDGKNQGQIKLLNMKRMSELFKGFKSKLFCTYILCEHEEGWHSCDNAILLPRDTWNVYLEKFAPYLARIMAIMKYSKHQLLSCMGEEEGQQYIKWLEECPQANVSDFQQIYHELRREIVELDSRKTKGQLARCHLPNGKTIWLCEKHRSQMRVTVLSGEVASTTHKERENPTVTTMIQELRLPSNQLLAAKFKSCRKSRRNPSDKKKKFGNVVQRDNQVGETQSSRTGLESTSPSKKRKAAQPTQRPSQITLLNSSVASLHRLGTANENSDEVDSSVRTQTPPANQESRDKKVAPRSSISDGVDSSKSKQNIGETESKEMGDARQDEKGIGGIQTPSANQGLKKNAEPSSPKLGTIDSHIDSHRDNESKERETAAAKQVAMAMGQNIERRQTIPGMEASTTSKSSKLIRQKSKACAVM